MPKWWPFGRGQAIDAGESAAPAAPAAEPAWRRLPAIQRTIGDIESTTGLAEFTGALTTSQNPTLTGSLDLLAANGSDRLPVLDVTPNAGGATPSPESSTPRTMPGSRSFAPPPMKVQRALLEPEAAAPPMGDMPESPQPLVLHPVQSEEGQPSMVEAPSPDERRPLQVVEVLDAPSASPPPSSPIPTSSPARTPLQRTIAPTPAPRTTPPASPVQRTAAPSYPTPPAPTHNQPDADSRSQTASARITREPVVATPLKALADTPLARVQPLRTVSSVQRSEGDRASSSTQFARVGSIPVLPTIASTASAPFGPDHPRPAAPTPPTTGSVAAQRSTSPLAPVSATAKGPTPRPGSSSTMVQRSTENAVGDHPSPPSMPHVEPRSLPVPDVRNGGGGAPPIGVQRSFDGPSTTTTVSSRSVVQRGGDVLQSSPAAARNSRVEPHIGHSDPGSVHSPLDSDAGVHPEPVQRLELPVVSHDLTVGDARPPTPYSTNAAAVQRAATGGRVVVLPPVRRTASAPSVSDSPPASPVRSVLAESTRPIGLQRMFEGAVRSDVMPQRSGESSDGPTRAIEPRGDDVAANRFTGFQDHGDSGAHYDTATNTITFGAPTIQRAPDSTPPAEASTETPPVSASPSTALSVAPATTSAEPNVDELVNRLYDPLAARLRAELWLDRERAGVLMDLGR